MSVTELDLGLWTGWDSDQMTRVTSVWMRRRLCSYRIYLRKSKHKGSENTGEAFQDSLSQFLIYRHGGQSQSRCDSITNEGQITGMLGWQRRGGDEGRASQLGGGREDEIWRTGWGEETGGDSKEKPICEDEPSANEGQMTALWALRPSCNWGRREEVWCKHRAEPSSHHSGLWRQR